MRRIADFEVRGKTVLVRADLNCPVDAGKIIAAICHGPQLLISANIVRGRRVTSWPSVAIDLRNAGADWVDEPVAQDGNLITSRKPADLPRFNKAIIEAIRD